MSDESEDEGGLPPVKADNEVWRDLCRWESKVPDILKLAGL